MFGSRTETNNLFGSVLSFSSVSDQAQKACTTVTAASFSLAIRKILGLWHPTTIYCKGIYSIMFTRWELLTRTFSLEAIFITMILSMSTVQLGAWKFVGRQFRVAGLASNSVVPAGFESVRSPTADMCNSCSDAF